MPNSVKGTRFRETKAHSSDDGFFDSRHARTPGIGFPSACRDLVLAPRNRRDPHDYYAELGVDPAASREAIKSVVRALSRQLHPDTGENPDPERLTRVLNIAEVLLDDVERFKYDHTPEGARLNDKVFRESVSRLNPAAQRILREHIERKVAAPVGRFDYFALGWRTTDSLKAQQWYHYLLANIATTEHRGRLRLLLWDGPRPAWKVDTEVLMVPRSWPPSTFAAAHLLRHVVSSPNAQA